MEAKVDQSGGEYLISTTTSSTATLQYENNSYCMFDDYLVKLVRGRTAYSQNLVHRGFDALKSYSTTMSNL